MRFRTIRGKESETHRMHFRVGKYVRNSSVERVDLNALLDGSTLYSRLGVKPRDRCASERFGEKYPKLIGCTSESGNMSETHRWSELTSTRFWTDRLYIRVLGSSRATDALPNDSGKRIRNSSDALPSREICPKLIGGAS